MLEGLKESELGDVQNGLTYCLESERKANNAHCIILMFRVTHRFYHYEVIPHLSCMLTRGRNTRTHVV